jgi:hypothetical protein
MRGIRQRIAWAAHHAPVLDLDQVASERSLRASCPRYPSVIVVPSTETIGNTTDPLSRDHVKVAAVAALFALSGGSIPFRASPARWISTR